VGIAVAVALALAGRNYAQQPRHQIALLSPRTQKDFEKKQLRFEFEVHAPCRVESLEVSVGRWSVTMTGPPWVREVDRDRWGIRPNSSVTAKAKDACGNLLGFKRAIIEDNGDRL
jgi:hypothetical protein